MEDIVRCPFFYKACVVGALTLTFCFGGANAIAKNRKESKPFVIETNVSSVSPGDDGAVSLTITAARGYKWNEKFPAAIRIGEVAKNTHIRFAKSSFSSKDFKVERGLRSAGVKIPFKAVSKGRQTITAKVRFSVCTAEACIVKNESVEITVSVK
jgi:hypothetical protein